MKSTDALIYFSANMEAEPQDFDNADVSPAALALRSDSTQADQTSLNLRKRNLAGASLRSANLQAADLTAADLSRSSCTGISLNNARLEGANLRAADLVGADLSGVHAGEADFQEAFLEDASLEDARLRFANFTDAILDGANLGRADLWGVKFLHATADRVLFHNARLDESSLAEADFSGADFSGATLRRADLANAKLRNANLRDTILEGANLAGADLTGALLPNVSLSSCNLTRVSFSGAWLERTRMRARQLGPEVGEETAGNFEAAIDSYVVLERNFLSLGASDDARWAYLRRRRVGRKLHEKQARAEFSAKHWRRSLPFAFLWFSDVASEWLCDYGESLFRVGRAFVVILFSFALLYWVTGSLTARDEAQVSHAWTPINYLLFSLNSMTTVGTSEVALRPKSELGILLSSLQTVMGTILLGLFGFVLGARIRS